MKVKTIWNCTECGQSTVRWSGQCPGCAAWNTMVEEIQAPRSARATHSTLQTSSSLKRLNEISLAPMQRMMSGITEFDRVLGGGIVPGALILLGGEPGIGKSTLSLQLAEGIARTHGNVLYVSGEESLEQISLRARRLGLDGNSLFFLAETEVSSIDAHVRELKPAACIIDSIQIVHRAELPSAPGSVSQVRESTCAFMHMAKSLNIATFVIGHVTKSGEIAGPKVLEHLVDTVLYFEGDRQHEFRLVRVVKNRFGPTDEVAIFRMQQSGLVQVQSPSELFLEGRSQATSGSVIIPTVEGTRPILLEVQALVADTFYPTPTRKCSGFDPNRLALLLAVLEKRARIQLHQRDIFASIAGGMKIAEPAADLGILLAITSAHKNVAIDPQLVVVGEVGLSGEVRSVSRIEARMKEAAHLGFRKAIIPARAHRALSKDIRDSLEIHPVERVEEALKWALR